MDPRDYIDDFEGREDMRRGIAVYCTLCGKRKAPHGRSVPMEMHGSLCTSDCAGYDTEPKPGCLWPGEEMFSGACNYATELA